MEIIRAQRCEEDRLKEAMDLVWRVFSEFEAPEYSSEGIEVFREFVSWESVVQLMENDVFQLWYALESGRIIGVLAATCVPCHINLLFVDRDWHRKGVAKDLVEGMIRWVKQEYPSETAVTVNASPYGLQAYRRMGFGDLDVEQLRDGLRFIPMVHFF